MHDLLQKSICSCAALGIVATSRMVVFHQTINGLTATIGNKDNNASQQFQVVLLV